MTETTAAAERLRRCYAGAESMLDVYGREALSLMKMHDDTQLVADAYLALVQPDDATPLNTAATFDWLDKLKPAAGDLSMLCVRMYDDGLHLVINDYVCPAVATKGDVRSLGRVLGIPLTGDVQ